MIDLHTHILPYIDDGAKDIETAVAIMNAELQQGVKTVLLTSHYYGRKLSPAKFLEARDKSFAELKPHIPEGLEVRLGAEVHFTGVNTPPYEELCKLAIQGTEYVLIEFSFTRAWSHTLLEQLADFMDKTGYKVIIAHVERYGEVERNPDLITKLVQMGCLIQVNVNSFMNKETRNLTRALLKHGFVHCIGTDTHDMERRMPNVAKVKETLCAEGYSVEWERAQRIMQAVIAGEQVRVEAGKRIKKFFGRYF